MTEHSIPHLNGMFFFYTMLLLCMHFPFTGSSSEYICKIFNSIDKCYFSDSPEQIEYVQHIKIKTGRNVIFNAYTFFLFSSSSSSYFFFSISAIKYVFFILELDFFYVFLISFRLLVTKSNKCLVNTK